MTPTSAQPPASEPSDPGHCIHCGLPIEPCDLVTDQINGATLHFCCRGCQGVYRIIHGAGLDRFYQQRHWDDQGVPDGVFELEFDDAALAGHVVAKDENSAQIALVIEGIRCASCVWLLEKLVSKEPGIDHVVVNYGTHKANIAFNPQQTTPAAIFSAVSRLGYRPHPYSAGSAQQAATREQRSLLIRFGTAAFLS
ncbi:MAG: heavy metal translocating P-type ATPase metal-binding domain-containing protein, partial [Desulfuromonadales bacterium]|nr:heavy metal translocating P-type ATPase metal-binding domain-containing protein [Desulfuromonadales bacterium]